MTTVTVLIPNYNRPQALSKALYSIFLSIDNAKASDRVNVTVVDDYSTVDISKAISPFRHRKNFTFVTQKTKCGNAEMAFLSALDYVGGTFVWLVGNDDQLMPHGVTALLKLIDNTDLGFILLNPIIAGASVTRPSTPIVANSSVVIYPKTQDLFADFGFVTSTTTFSCIVAHTATLRAFHKEHRLTDHAKVYSHTFSLFCAHRQQPAAFISTPLTSFSLNEPSEETIKLARQAPNRIMFYHQSIGLALLIRAAANASGLPIAHLGRCNEDEIAKDDLRVWQIRLSSFLVFFSLQQMVEEQREIKRSDAYHGYMSRADFDLLKSIVAAFEEDFLVRALDQADDIYALSTQTPDWKINFIASIQSEIRKYAKNTLLETACPVSSSATRKIATQSFSTFPLRGQRADERGRIYAAPPPMPRINTRDAVWVW
ncbi:hypothetical protein RHAL1_02942 [Beijerinckiaceae bacterium RH AL1]|nr:glycosyltransferase [Beijerinckiaceae bacterium]VVB47691.1 hypothetical protein RHCH11_RHCH11_02881 [Beijerinckiaceae bacterium RH CH11]VVB47772.1 hypothetical protein RHAL8_02877 [Beijerinckiaceae bacterium RH AL8]VVC56016.1 hypothetical protein RHAL1_02942 [Beijerinckiaceae bacterium RH AL1]